MRNFVKGMITNRFGIILATLNVCYFVSRDLVRYTFEHTHGEKYLWGNIVVEKCFSTGDFILVLTGLQPNEVMRLINLPALILSLFSNKLINIAFSGSCFFTQAKFQIAFIIFFITFQWLFIGWAAKTIAARIRPEQS